jgi:hypothetical protein
MKKENNYCIIVSNIHFKNYNRRHHENSPSKHNYSYIKTYSLNKIFSGQQPHQAVEWRINQRCEGHFCPLHHESDEVDRDGPQTVALLTIQPPDAADRPRIFY